MLVCSIQASRGYDTRREVTAIFGTGFRIRHPQKHAEILLTTGAQATTILASRA